MKNSLFRSFRNISVKTSLFVLLLLIITSLVFYAVTIQIMCNRINSEVIKRAESLSRSIASTAGYSSLSIDILGLDTLAFKVKNSNQDIENIAIVNTESEILAHSDVNKTGEVYYPSQGIIFKTSEDGTQIREIKSPHENFFEITSPIIFMGKKLGLVILHINKSVLYNAQKEAIRKIAWVFVIILLLGTMSSVFLSSFLMRPIRALSTGVEDLKKGKKGQQLRIYSQDELGRLTESFNEMTILITSQNEKLSKYAQNLEESYVSTVKVLVAVIDARDHYTLGHSMRVSKLSVLLGKLLGLSQKELDELEISCLFHDIGKIKIPDSILLKKNKLNDSEQKEMMRHPEYGADILSKASSLGRYIPIVKYHHEWYNGTGYPDGLKGEKIPKMASIMTLADAFDAMTSNRPYRKALTSEKALQQMQDLCGKQFHPKLLIKFTSMIRERKFELPRQF